MDSAGTSTPLLRGKVGFSPHHVLVVEDDLAVARSIARHVPQPLHPWTARTLREARRALDMVFSPVAAVVDIGLPDGSGLEIVRAIRARGLSTHVLVLTGQLDRRLINQTQALRAHYVCKPEFHDNLDNFFAHLAPGEEINVDTETVVHRTARAFDLSRREAVILTHSMNGVPRSHLADVMAVSENTLKSQIRSLLEKTQQNSLSELVWHMRRPSVTPKRGRGGK
jgi:DNA-binding NarL/FixJ family response regulator